MNREQWWHGEIPAGLPKKPRLSLRWRIAIVIWVLLSPYVFSRLIIYEGLRRPGVNPQIQTIDFARVSPNKGVVICGTALFREYVEPHPFEMAVPVPRPEDSSAHTPATIKDEDITTSCDKHLGGEPLIVQEVPNDVSFDDAEREISRAGGKALLWSEGLLVLVFGDSQTASRTYWLGEGSGASNPRELVYLPLMLAVDAGLGPIGWVFYLSFTQHGKRASLSWDIPWLFRRLSEEIQE